MTDWFFLSILPSRTGRLVIRYKFNDVSEESSTSLFRVNLNLDAGCSPETAVNICQTTRCHIPGENVLQNHRYDNLKCDDTICSFLHFFQRIHRRQGQTWTPSTRPCYSTFVIACLLQPFLQKRTYQLIHCHELTGYLAYQPKFILLGAFAKCEKRLLSSSCLSVGMEQFGSHWVDVHEIWYLSIFWKSFEKIQVELKSDRNNGYFTGIPMCIYDISLNAS